MPRDAHGTYAVRGVRFAAAARFVAEGAWAACALVTGVVVARHLGTDGKGTVSSLSYLIALVAPISALGLGEAGVTLMRGHGDPLVRVVRGTIGLLVPAALAGSLLVLVFIAVQFSEDLGDLEVASAAAVVAVPAMAAWSVLSMLMEAEGGVVASSAIKVLTGVTTAVLTWLLVLELTLAVAGAVLALAAGWVVGALAAAGWLWAKRSAPPLPGWDRDYMRRALRLGRPVQASYVVAGLAARADLLVVQILKGSSTAGLYSVALTMGQLVSYGPIALAVVSFGVAAGLEDDEAPAFIERSGRRAVVVTCLIAVVLAPLIPIILPRLFGAGFDDSVAMTLILLPGGMLAGVQWVVCRLWAARGESRLLFRSLAASLVAMLLADLVLIPPFGGTGAAVAATSASVIGLLTALRGHRALSGGRGRYRAFVPALADFSDITGLLRSRDKDH